MGVGKQVLHAQIQTFRDPYLRLKSGGLGSPLERLWGLFGTVHQRLGSLEPLVKAN